MSRMTMTGLPIHSAINPVFLNRAIEVRTMTAVIVVTAVVAGLAGTIVIAVMAAIVTAVTVGLVDMIAMVADMAATEDILAPPTEVVLADGSMALAVHLLIRNSPRVYILPQDTFTIPAASLRGFPMSTKLRRSYKHSISTRDLDIPSISLAFLILCH